MNLILLRTQEVLAGAAVTKQALYKVGQWEGA